MTEKEIDALYAHAGKLVAERKSLAGVFEYYDLARKEWFIIPNGGRTIPDFNDGDEWRIAKPKKQIIDWSHPYFKGCRTNAGEFLRKSFFVFLCITPEGAGAGVDTKDLRLATPDDKDSNWQYFHSTPENNEKLRELAKMVKVELRWWNAAVYGHEVMPYDNDFVHHRVSNYRITGLQDGWTDNLDEAGNV